MGIASCCHGADGAGVAISVGRAQITVNPPKLVVISDECSLGGQRVWGMRRLLVSLSTDCDGRGNVWVVKAWGGKFFFRRSSR